MFRVLFSLLLVTLAASKKIKSYSEEHKCHLSQDLKDEIASYNTVAQDIIDYAVAGPFSGKTYDELSKFVDKFGPRLAGSDVLERAIDYMINLALDEEVRDITTEKVDVPHWVRGFESVTMLEPRLKNMSVLGLGGSISTPPEGITGEVILVNSFEEFDELDDDEVKDKIVVWDPVFTTYGETVKYRSEVATRSAKKGAVASLLRSVTPFSINSPHTGMQTYGENVTKIPTACITIEDADLMKRLIARNESILLHIKLFSTLDYKVSRNTLIDIKGTAKPEKLVIVSGHIDSWDVGQGAMDDGGGMMISWAVPVILKRLNLKPRRTVRSILWTSEEPGLIGAAAYVKQHKDELKDINIIMESDEGTFTPLGLEVAGTQEARCIVAEVLKLFEGINATKMVESDYPGSDIVLAIQEGVPGASLLNQNEKYFWFHHTEADTMNVENPKELDLCTAFWTAVSYILADISVDIPRKTSA